jgi:ABC-type transporter Mla subunit MlaD
MSAATTPNYWKLGLFIVSGVTLGLLVLAFLGVRATRKDTFDAVTYFDESVQGLDVGAPVKFRGVTTGSVSKIGIAPDHRRVEVVCEMDRGQLQRAGLTPQAGPWRNVRPDLRVQLSQIGIAGTMFVLVEIVDPETHPTPRLTFETPPNYVPAIPSTFKDIAEQLRDALQHIPPLIASTKDAIHDADIAGISSRIKAILDTAEEVMRPLPPLAEKLARDDGLAATVAEIGSAARSAGRQIGSPEVAATVTAIREMAITIRKTASDLDRLTERTDVDLEALHEAIRALKVLADELEHDPGSVIRGKAPEKTPQESP